MQMSISKLQTYLIGKGWLCTTSDRWFLGKGNAGHAVPILAAGAFQTAADGFLGDERKECAKLSPKRPTQDQVGLADDEWGSYREGFADGLAEYSAAIRNRHTDEVEQRCREMCDKCRAGRDVFPPVGQGFRGPYWTHLGEPGGVVAVCVADLIRKRGAL